MIAIIYEITSLIFWDYWLLVYNSDADRSLCNDLTSTALLNLLALLDFILCNLEFFLLWNSTKDRQVISSFPFWMFFNYVSFRVVLDWAGYVAQKWWRWVSLFRHLVKVTAGDSLLTVWTQNHGCSYLVISPRCSFDVASNLSTMDPVNTHLDMLLMP